MRVSLSWPCATLSWFQNASGCVFSIFISFWICFFKFPTMYVSHSWMCQPPKDHPKKKCFIFFQKDCQPPKKTRKKGIIQIVLTQKNVGKPRVISFCFANQPLILRLLRVTWKSLSFYHRNRLRQLGMPKILCWKVKGFITSNIP